MRYLMIHWIDKAALDGVAATPGKGKVPCDRR